MKIEKAAMIGMGAIGAIYGQKLNQTYGEDFAAVAGGSRARRLRENGVVVNGESFAPRVAEPGEEFAADLVLVSVKNYQLDRAVEDIRGFVGRGTVILPLLNGVTARDRLAAAFPGNTVLYGLVIYIDAVRTDAGVVHTKDGVIQFGEADNTSPSPAVEAVRRYLDGAGIQTEVCPDMIRAVWKKWMMNVGVNQVSAVTRFPYGKIGAVPPALALLHEAMMEVVALANASGIDLTEREAREFEDLFGSFSPAGKTSMLQDVEAKRRTEVDYFGGTAERLGEKLHVPTPVNHVLTLLIKSIEAAY